MTRTIDARRYNTDKPGFDEYFRTYEELFAPLAGGEVRLLELGVSRGGSLEIWRDYFPRGIIAGIDMAPVSLRDDSGRIRIYQGLQQDTALLDRVRAECAPEGFDVIIDDCSHIGEFTALSFWHLFDRHLRPGGLYIIEDWGSGYMRGSPDGRAYTPPRPGPSFRSRLRRPVEALLASGAVASRPGLRRIVRALMNRLVRMTASLTPKTMRASHVTIAQMMHPEHANSLGDVHGGWIMKLVDEAGMADITHPAWGTPPPRASRFRYIRISHGQVVIAKSS
jgi:SAM-dependent methyltransferase